MSWSLNQTIELVTSGSLLFEPLVVLRMHLDFECLVECTLIEEATMLLG